VYPSIQGISRPNKTKSVHEPKDKERMKKQNPSHGSCTQESTRNPKSNNLCSLEEIMVNNP
jgi:hypothetical protein